MDFLDFGTFWWFYLIGVFSGSFGLNDLLKYREKRERAQQEELVKTFVEMVQGGKKRTHAEKLEDLFSQSPPFISEEFYNQLLRLHNGGFSYPLAMKIIFKKYTISAQNLCG